MVLSSLLVIGCGSDDDQSASDGGASTSSSSETSLGGSGDSSDESSDTATTLPIDTASTQAPGDASTDPNATGTILMLKLYVGDLDAAEEFYGTVFGATPSLEMGDTVHIVSFPDGGPGLVLIEADDADDKHGSFIIQVPDLAASKAAAVANGATEQDTFAGSPGGEAAQSVNVLDPWGNQVEILQIG